MITILSLLPAIEAHLPAEPRTKAILTSLREIAALPGAAVPWYALDAAFESLATGRPSDDPATTARRFTLAQVHRAISRAPGYGTAPPVSLGWAIRAALPWFDAQVDAWALSDNPRHAAMARTADRERAELRSRLTPTP